MTAFSTALPLAFAYLRERLMATLLNIILLGLGVGTILALLLTLSQAEQRMERDAGGIDLVVGAKGSPLQLILSAVFNVDIPTGNIPLAEAMLISAEPMVKRAIPLSLGDSFRSFRIVGTNPEYLDLYQAGLAAGRLGRPEEFGDACAFLCSAQAGFISGQNLQLDGGSYAGVF